MPVTCLSHVCHMQVLTHNLPRLELIGCRLPCHDKAVSLEQLALVHTLSEEVQGNHWDPKLSRHAHLVRLLALLGIAHNQMRRLRESPVRMTLSHFVSSTDTQSTMRMTLG